MILQLEEEYLEAIKSYKLPSFNEIPDVGLYLNQSATYINKALSPLFDQAITESMISNYVKKKLIDNPIKKQYSREMIAYLMFIAISKNVASLDDLQFLIRKQREKYSSQESYEYFKMTFETIVKEVFGFEKKTEETEKKSVEEELLKNIIVTVAHKLYVDIAFRELKKKDESKT